MLEPLPVIRHLKFLAFEYITLCLHHIKSAPLRQRKCKIVFNNCLVPSSSSLRNLKLNFLAIAKSMQFSGFHEPVNYVLHEVY